MVDTDVGRTRRQRESPNCPECKCDDDLHTADVVNKWLNVAKTSLMIGFFVVLIYFVIWLLLLGGWQEIVDYFAGYFPKFE